MTLARGHLNLAIPAKSTNPFTLSTIPLSEVATISVGAGPSEITRMNKQREIEVNASLAGIPLSDAIKATTQVMNGISLPAGYHWQFGPSVTDQADTFSSLGLIVTLAILLIYMLLASLLESFLHPLIIMRRAALAGRRAGVADAAFLGLTAIGVRCWSASACERHPGGRVHQPTAPSDERRARC